MAKIDIFDLGYLYFSVGYDFEKSRSKSYDKYFSGYVGGFFYFLFRFVYSLVRQGRKFKTLTPEQSKCLFVGMSNNNRRSLQPIIDAIGEDQVGALTSDKIVPMWRMYWHALPHLGDLIRDIKSATPEQRKIMKLRFLYFWRGYGCPDFANDLLDFYNPKVIVVANDHLFYYRALIQEANKRGVKTIYVQHAAVTDKFPPLDLSYAFLDGKDSFNKYLSAGECKGEVYLMGGVRFDAIKGNETRPTDKYRIGVALNLLDDTEKVRTACKELLALNTSKPIEVILRPHPAVLYRPWVDWCAENGVTISLPSEQSSFDYLESLSLLVSNQSSIHLDAAMCHTPALIYNMATTKPADGYGFLKNGLVKEYDSVESITPVLESLDSFQYDVDTVRLYNGSFGASYEGHVAETIANLIEEVLAGTTNLFNEKHKMKLLQQRNDYKVYGPSKTL